MSPIDPDHIEKSLESLSPRAAPPELKATILGAASESREEIGMTPRLWWAAAVCSVLVMIAVWGDAAVSKSQSKYFFSLLNVPYVSPAVDEDSQPLVAEFYGMIPELEKSILAGNFLTRMGIGRISPKDSIEAWERLKGRINEEIEENID